MRDVSERRGAVARPATSTTAACRRRRGRSWAAAADICKWDGRPIHEVGPGAGPPRHGSGAVDGAAATRAADFGPANSPTRCPVSAFPFPGPRASSAGCRSGDLPGLPRSASPAASATTTTKTPPPPTTSSAVGSAADGAASVWTWTAGAVPANGSRWTRPTLTAWTCRFSLREKPFN